jgi:hypothetical protein
MVCLLNFKGLLCVTLMYALTTCVWLALAIGVIFPLADNKFIEPISCFTFMGVMTFLSTICHLRSMFTDPGRLTQNTVDSSENCDAVSD